MAGQREYQMLFQLNARLGSQYSSTLKAAQSELVRFNQEYRNLSKTANDISAYQRQQTAVENTKSKLELLQQQYDNIQKEMQETGTYSSDLENKLLAKQAQIDKTTKAYNDQIAKLDEYKRRLEEAGVDTSELDKESERLKGELKNLQSGFENAGDGAENFGEKGGNALENIETMLASAGIIKGLKEIYSAFSECVTVAADFEESMSNVEAISGANEEEIAALTERAKELGASTAFTAKQVSEGMSYMAMAGWKTTDMLDGMDAVLALAAASGEDLGTTSDIVTDALTAFGLRASDTARFADVLAATASNANTNVGMMGETFKYAAPVAGALGYSIEDVAVAIGLMANSGIKASSAGTTLRNIFNGILGGVDLTSEAFGDLNVSFVNADGTMMDLSTTINKLRGYFDQMTEAEKVQNAVSMAGQRGYAGLLAILNSTTEDYDKLTNAVNNSTGAAQKMADIKLDNMNGQLTIAKSAWEGLQIVIGDQFTPVLTKVFKVAADVIGHITTFVKENPKVVKAIASVAAGIGIFVAAVTAAKLAMIAFNAIAAMNPFVMIGSAVTAAVAALAIWTMTMEDTYDATQNLTGASQAQYDELEKLKKEYEEVCETEGETSANAILLKNKIDEANAAFEENRQTLAEWSERNEKILEEHNQIVQEYKEETERIAKNHTSLDSLIARLYELGEKTHYSSSELEVLNALIDEINERLPEANISFDVSTGSLNMTEEDLRAVAKAAAEAQQKAADLQEYLKLVGEEDILDQEVRSAWENVEAQQKRVDEAWSKYQASKREYDSVYGKQATWDPELYKAWAAEKEVLEDKTTEWENNTAALEYNRSEQQRLSEALGTTTEAGEEQAAYIYQMQDILDTYSERVETLTQSYLDAYNAAYDSITGQYKLWDDVAEVSATSVDAVIKNMEKQQKYWSDYKTNIDLLLSYSDQIEGLSDMVSTFGNGSAESVNMIAGMAEAAKSGNPEKITEMVEAWQANKQAQDEAAQSLGDLVTRYTGQMDELKEQVAQDVSDLKFSDEAYLAASDTVQSFIDGAISKMPAVQTAYARIASAATSALATSRTPHNATYLYDNTGYASGTDYATPGAHLVGEHGPELLWFRGGESVMDASQTRDFLRAMQSEPVTPSAPASGGSSVQISFAPVYQLSGAADSAEIRAVLEAHDEEMKRQIRDMLAEEMEDQVRRRM